MDRDKDRDRDIIKEARARVRVRVIMVRDSRDYSMAKGSGSEWELLACKARKAIPV